MKKKYYITQENDEITVHINEKQLDGFKIKPLNKVKYDGVLVSKMTLVSPDVIKIVLQKKTKRKLDSFIEFIINTTEEDDDTDPSELMFVLDEVERYKTLVRAKYAKYLDEKYTEALVKKMDILKKELKEQIKSIEAVYEKEKTGKSR